MPPPISAALDVGSTAIRLLIAEECLDGGLRTLESLERSCELGRDVFTRGSISPDSFKHVIEVVRDYLDVLRSWQLPPDRLQAFATSAVREAANRDLFLDRILIATGLELRVIEGVEANQLTYMAARHALRDWKGLARTNTLMMEVSGGTTELLFLRRGEMAASHTLPLGVIRLAQLSEGQGDLSLLTEDHIRKAMSHTASLLDAQIRDCSTSSFIVMGSEMRLAARLVGTAHGADCLAISRADFTALLRQLKGKSIEESATAYALTYVEAAALLPALLIVHAFMHLTDASQLLVPLVSIREGAILAARQGGLDHRSADTIAQIRAASENLLHRFHADEDHAALVAHNAMVLFDALRPLHALGDESRLHLEVAATLHDIGKFINLSGHHKHSAYIVQNTEIFGLSREDLALIAQVIRYHRKAIPQSAHTAWMSLSSADRLAVLKLSAILRLADGLDASGIAPIRLSAAELSGDQSELTLISPAFRRRRSSHTLAKHELLQQVFSLELAMRPEN